MKKEQTYLKVTNLKTGFRWSKACQHDYIREQVSRPTRIRLTISEY